MRPIQKYNTLIAGMMFFVFPAVASAAVVDIPSFFALVASVLNAVIPVIIGLAFVVFLWGIYKYVTTASLDGKAGAKETIIYGLIGLFVMLSAWGLVNVLIVTFFGDAGPATAPPWIPELVLPSSS